MSPDQMLAAVDNYVPTLLSTLDQTEKEKNNLLLDSLISSYTDQSEALKVLYLIYIKRNDLIKLDEKYRLILEALKTPANEKTIKTLIAVKAQSLFDRKRCFSEDFRLEEAQPEIIFACCTFRYLSRLAVGNAITDLNILELPYSEEQLTAIAAGCEITSLKTISLNGLNYDNTASMDTWTKSLLLLAKLDLTNVQHLDLGGNRLGALTAECFLAFVLGLKSLHLPNLIKVSLNHNELGGLIKVQIDTLVDLLGSMQNKLHLDLSMNGFNTISLTQSSILFESLGKLKIAGVDLGTCSILSNPEKGCQSNFFEFIKKSELNTLEMHTNHSYQPIIDAITYLQGSMVFCLKLSNNGFMMITEEQWADLLVCLKKTYITQLDLATQIPPEVEIEIKNILRKNKIRFELLEGKLSNAIIHTLWLTERPLSEDEKMYLPEELVEKYQSSAILK